MEYEVMGCLVCISVIGLTTGSVFVASKIAYNLGVQDSRKDTITFCNQKPDDCKTEFEFYSLKDKVEAFQNLPTK